MSKRRAGSRQRKKRFKQNLIHERDGTIQEQKKLSYISNLWHALIKNVNEFKQNHPVIVAFIIIAIAIAIAMTIGFFFINSNQRQNTLDVNDLTISNAEVNDVDWEHGEATSLLETQSDLLNLTTSVSNEAIVFDTTTDNEVQMLSSTAAEVSLHTLHGFPDDSESEKALSKSSYLSIDNQAYEKPLGSITLLVDHNHTDANLQKRLNNQIEKICSNKIGCIAILEGECKQKADRIYTYRLDVESYGRNYTGLQPRLFTLKGPSKCIGTFDYELKEELSLNDLLDKIFDSAVKAINKLYEIEDMCRTLTRESSCEIRDDTLKELGSQIIFAKDTKSIERFAEINNELFNFFHELNIFFEEYYKNSMEYINIKKTNKTLEEFSTFHSDIRKNYFNYLNQAIDVGDHATIKAIESVIDEVKNGLHLIVRMGYYHFSEGTKLSCYVVSLKNQGFFVELKEDRKKAKEFMPISTLFNRSSNCSN